VLNFAITGYGPNQYAQVVERFVPRFKPDLVIIESFVNDFSDVLTPQEEFVKGIGFEKPDPDGLRSVLTLGNLRTWLKQGVLGPRIARLRGKPDFRGLYFGGIIYLEREPDETEGETKLAERFARIRSVCQGEGARLLVASVPAAAQVCEPTQLPYFPAGVDLSDVSKYDVERPQRILKRIADALKADFVDLRGPLRKSPELPYQPANLHWTRAGHRVVAEHLALLLAEDEELMKRAGD
jgi:hypothetical protein